VRYRFPNSLVCLVYVSALFASVAADVDCHDGVTHAERHHAEHSHVHSKAQQAVHALLHAVMPDVGVTITSVHCCHAVNHAPHPLSHPYTVESRFDQPKNNPNQIAVLLPTGGDYSFGPQVRGWAALPRGPDLDRSVVSLRSVVLLS
jgi:hypothetical protein